MKTFPKKCAIFMSLLLAISIISTSGVVGSDAVYPNAAVAADAGVCSEIGVEILKKGGNAVDAAISSVLCAGTVNLHSTGIGGGGFLLYYEAATQQLHALDFREVAPMAASYDMYDGLEPTASTVGEHRTNMQKHRWLNNLLLLKVAFLWQCQGS